MHKVIFYPVGNGDTSQIVLENGKRILFDFRHLKKAENNEEPKINLKDQLNKELKEAGRSSFDVVAFTHGDRDHIENSTEFFELRYAVKYQGNGRIKIDTLWVPAAMILDTGTNDQQSDEFIIWRQEARYRLKEGKGIRVFSKPDKLKIWFEQNDLTVDSRRHLITDAGELAPDFTLDKDGVEFFCHSPFIKHVDDNYDLRNDAALIFNTRFKSGNNTFDYLAVGDSTCDVLEDIVQITKKHKNDDRLAWDLHNIPHHCSYKALSDDKGEKETVPNPLIEELLQMGKEGAYLVSSSNPIEDTKAGYEQTQPPHIQAKKCYQKYLRQVSGNKLFVTMEEPNLKQPEPLVFKIESSGISLDKKIVSAASIITSSPAPRAGKDE